MRGNIRPHLDHGLVPCNVWTFADLDADYGSDYTEYWCSVKRQYPLYYLSSGDRMLVDLTEECIRGFSSGDRGRHTDILH